MRAGSKDRHRWLVTLASAGLVLVLQGCAGPADHPVAAAQQAAVIKGLKASPVFVMTTAGTNDDRPIPMDGVNAYIDVQATAEVDSKIRDRLLAGRSETSPAPNSSQAPPQVGQITPTTSSTTEQTTIEQIRRAWRLDPLKTSEIRSGSRSVTDDGDEPATNNPATKKSAPEKHETDYALIEKAKAIYDYIDDMMSSANAILPADLMSPRTRVRVTFQSEPGGADINWKGQLIGNTQRTYALVAADIDKIDITLSGWLPCHATDARLPGWRMIDDGQSVVVSCMLHKATPP